jgi:membrane protein required for colicin V production
MNWLDLVFIGIIAVSVLISLVRGFVREVISILVWVGALWLAVRSSGALADVLARWVDSPTLSLVAAFAAIFIVTLLVGAVLNYLAGQLVGRTGLSGTDRSLGVVFGGARGLLIVALLVLVAGLTAIPREPWWQASRMATWMTPWVCSVGVAQWLDGLMLSAPVALGGEAPEATPAPDYWQDFCGRIRGGDLTAG